MKESFTLALQCTPTPFLHGSTDSTIEHESVKFDWKRIRKENKGHNKDEWSNNDTHTPIIIPVYKMKWEKDEEL